MDPTAQPTMGAMAVPVLALVVALYAAVATAYLEARRRRETPPRWARVAGPIAVLVHLAGLTALSAEIHRSPFATGGQALSFLSFSLAALYLVLEATSRIAVHGGAFFLAAAVLAAVGVPGLVAGVTPPTESHDAVRTVHVGLALLGTAAALAGGILGLGYLAAYRRVKRRVLEPGGDGPSLRGFERLERRASGLGLLLLGPALVLGIVVARDAGAPRGTAWLVGVTGFLFVLLSVAGFLWWRRPRRGSLAAWLNVSGTLVALAAFAVIHPLVVRSAG